MHLTMAGGTGSLVSGLRRLMEGKRYLYELPWYMVIGNAGAGKTSVLMNSGLKFPVGEQMGVASAHLGEVQDPGTQNCTWWFTNEAVLVDTAGRYTAPDSRNPEPEKQAEHHAEWLGFLGVLRRARPRAPINGALLAVDVSELLSSDEHQRINQAAQFRQRLEELRQQLGIRFPVYVVLTKSDRLRGFAEYFSSLTTEARAQVWGFTLPWAQNEASLAESLAKRGKKMAQTAAQATSVIGRSNKPVVSHTSTAAQADWPLTQQISVELAALQQRIADGVATRLQEEFDEDRRQALYLLPHEMQAFAPALQQLLEAVFTDSRYDTTQLGHTLRGVYWTSAMQHENATVVADTTSIVPRLLHATGKLMDMMKGRHGAQLGEPTTTRSYFVNDMLMRVVFPESHLVKPNLRWEARFRLLRLVGHALVGLIFFWIATGLLLSHKNNRDYLNGVDTKARALTEQVAHLYANMKVGDVTAALGAAQALPTHNGLDLGNPSAAYLYGLYTADGVEQTANVVYGQLQDRLVLPVILKRMEYVMREAVRNGDAQQASTTLRAYLLLHDVSQYQKTPSAAQELRSWVMQDWQQGDGKSATPALAAAAAPAVAVPNLATSFNNAAAMISYLEDMFSGRRVVQAATGANQDVVRQVRTFLDSRSSTQRLYDSAKLAMLADVPQDFTLVRALGPQAGTLFTRASGASMEKGVPGMFTYGGYHDVFVKRLPELVRQAFLDDQWLMGIGRSVGGAGDDASASSQKKNRLSLDENNAEIKAVAEDIRRQYLVEYAQRWNDFLEDVRVIRSNSGGGTLSFELDVLRRLAAAGSPLARLARMAAHETTLSRNLDISSNDADKSLLDKATAQIEQKSGQAALSAGLRPEQRMEKQLVDDRFAALREVVIGRSENGPAAANAQPEMDTITSLLNEYYTVLVVADTALAANSLPPSGTEVATKLKIEAGKLPAPLREVLLGVSDSGAVKVELGAAAILRTQAQAQMDRLMGLMALQVSTPCRRGVAGRYPFANSQQDVSIEDFNAVFAAGGTVDEFFTKNLLPLVDISVRPWRYKNPDSANMMQGPDALAQGQAMAAAKSGPTLTGELLKLLAKSGPDPEAFARMVQIRQAFFREPEAKRMAIKFNVSVQSLDPSIVELVMDFDGQAQRYAHGPVQPFAVQWPGPRGGTVAEISAKPGIRPDTSTLSSRGPWALFHLLDRGTIISSASAGRADVEFNFDNRRAVVSLDSGGSNPLTSNLFKGFSCPGG